MTKILITILFLCGSLLEAKNTSLLHGAELQTTPSDRGKTDIKGTLGQVDNNLKNSHGIHEGALKEVSQITDANLSKKKAAEAEIKALEAELKITRFKREASEAKIKAIDAEIKKSILQIPLLFVAAVLVLIIHEFGHLIAALYFGWRINVFALWRFWVIKRSKWKLEFGPASGRLGFVLHSPTDFSATFRAKKIATIVFGPVANLAVSLSCLLFLLIATNYDFQFQTVNIIQQEGSLTEYFLMQLLIFNFIGLLNILPVGKSDGANLLATLRAAELNPLQYSIQHFDEATNLGLAPEEIGPHCLEAALVVSEISALKAEAEFRLFQVYSVSMNTKRKETSYTNFMKHAHLLEPNRMKELVGLSQRVKHKLSETSLCFDSDSKNEPEGESEIEPPDPFNNLTPQSKLVLTLAREQASRFNHKFLGSEHLLLGLIKIGQGGAANVLKKMGLDLETVRLEVEKQVGARLSKKQLAIVITPRVKKVLNRAAKEAKQLQHAYVGTEHILLGLLREGDGVAARVLNNLDVDLKETRKEIIRELFLNRAAEDGDAGGLGLTKEGEKDGDEAKGVMESASRRTDTPTETSRQKSDEYKFCQECGQSAQPSDKFCTKCGSCLRKA